MKRDVMGEKVVDQMVLLARRQRVEGSPRTPVFVEQIDDVLQARRVARRRTRSLAVSSIALAACICLGLLSFRQLAPAPLKYSVVGGSISAGYLQGGSDTHVRFSDGSEVVLAEGSRARVNELTAHGALVELEHGKVAVDIVKAPKNAWFVKAGPYTVRVTGTAFEVVWASEPQRFELNLIRGSVVVTGPPITGAITLQAGQKLTSLHGKAVKVDSGAPLRAAESPPDVVSGPPAGEPVSLGAASATHADGIPGSELHADSSPAGNWGHWVAQGRFHVVLADAQRRGLDRVLATASLADLSALADAARYARSTQLARQALLDERRRFPKSQAARDAAFFLGGLDDQGAQSSQEWYARYLSESPRGAYAPQALGHRMMLVYRQGGTSASQPLAEEYLTRFPRGPYASAARKIIERSPK